jgi:hypothetical protein
MAQIYVNSPYFIHWEYSFIHCLCSFVQPNRQLIRLIVVKVNKNEILSSEKIREINDALMIMRHFVDLSAKLLPFLAELQGKKNLSDEDQADKNKIVQVFNTYNFETATSDILMRSPILELIKNAYRDLLTCDNSQTDEVLQHFSEEYNRIKRNWQYARMN